MVRCLNLTPATVHSGDQVQLAPWQTDANGWPYTILPASPEGALEVVGFLPVEAAPFNTVVRASDGQCFAVVLASVPVPVA